jgi:hypothetical protein
VDLVGAEAGCPPVKGRQLDFRLAVPAGADDPARQLPGDPATVLLGFCPRGGMGDPLDGVVVVGDDRPLLPDAKVDPAAGVRLTRDAGGVSDDGRDRHEQPSAMLGQRHRQHPCAALDQQALKPPGVLLGAQTADNRQGEMAAVGLQAHRPSGEADPAAVTVAGLEAGKPDPRASAAAVLGI